MLRTQAPLQLRRILRNRSPANRTCTPTASNTRNERSLNRPSPLPFRPKSTDKRGHRRNVKSQITNEPTLERGKQQMARQRYSEAIECFREVIRQDPQSLDALYSRGVCYMHLNDHRQALPDLLAVIKLNPLFEKQTYIAVAMCFVATNDRSAAIRQLSKGLQKFPKFTEGYIIRGQILNQLQRWEKAVRDFRKAISISPKEGAAFVGLSDSLIGLGDLQTAVKVLTQAIMCPESRQKALLKRAKLFFKDKDFQNALADAEKYTSHDSENAEGFYLKSLCLIELKLYTEAVLALEQVVKHDLSNTYLGDAIFHIGAIRIKEKDFYGAIHTFKRAPPKLQVKDQPILTIYAEAVINLMKRNYKDGVSAFSKLIRKNYPVLSDYIGNCYAFRGYGYAAMAKNEKALKDFKSAKSLNALDKASRYNEILSRALVKLSRNNESKAVEYFGRALKEFPRNTDPLLYHAAVLLKSGSLNESEELLNKAVKLRDSDCEFFFRSVVRYLMGKPKEAIEDAKQAIEKAEDNMSEHYMIKGLCQASIQDFQEALQDFSIAIQLDPALEKAYLYRAKCAYMIDDSTTAFGDFEKLIELNPKNQSYQLQTGNLLMMAGSYDDALKTYENASANNAETSVLKAKAHIMLGNLDKATAELLKTSSLNSDREMLGLLIQITREQNYPRLLENIEKCEGGEIFDLKHIRWFKGVLLMYMNQYEQALQEFQIVLEFIHTHDPSELSSDEALTAEEENCEVLYNIALCHMSSNPKHSLSIFRDLSEVLNSKHRGQVLFLSGIVEMSLDNKLKAESLFKEAAKGDPDSISPFFKGKKTVILPLNTSNEFSEKFPLIRLPRSSDPTVMVRPAICLPRVKPPGFDFEIDKSAQEYFTVAKVVPKPEAPWLNRVKGSIQFTDNIFNLESEASEETVFEREEDSESEDEQERKVKSAAAIRRFSSENINSGLEEPSLEPDEILDRIKAICQK